MRFLAVGILLFSGLSAFAADVDGKWSGAVSTPKGDFNVSFTFKADGTTLTGAMVAMDGNSNPIKEGKIEGNNLSFTVDLDFGGQPFTLNYKGVLSEDQIKFDGDAGGGRTFELVVKKNKDS